MKNTFTYQDAKRALGRIPVAGDAIYDADTDERIWESNAKPTCHICHKTAEITLAIGSRIDDWFFVQCDACDEYVCSDCWSEGVDDLPECHDCYGSRIGI